MKTGSVVLLVIIGILLIGGIIYFSMQTPKQASGQVTGSNQQTTPTSPTVTTSTTPGSMSTGVKYDVNIMSFAFTPQTLTITPGSTVIWTNSDSVAHTVVSDSGSEIDSPSLTKGESFSHTFTTPGTYTYHCSVHPNMKGTIIVSSSTTTSSGSSGGGGGYY